MGDSIIHSTIISGKDLKKPNFKRVNRWFRYNELGQNKLKAYKNLIIPGKNMKIKFSKENASFYCDLINKYEIEKVYYMDGRVYDNGEFIQTYTFKKDYFFLLGDNRSKSIDSRHFGLIPEELLIGKAKYVLSSLNKKLPFKKKRSANQ
nr:S26 family signal peptidase [Marinifilum caeruleilacunae]